MLKYGEYSVEILGMPSGEILIISMLSISELKKRDLIKYKRNIKMYGELKPIHGWIFLDTNKHDVEKIDRI